MKLLPVALLALLIVVAGSLGASRALASSPEDLTVTNLRNDRASVIWFTAAAETGQIRYDRDLTLDFAAADDRGGSAQVKAHHVTLTGLFPQTTYYYEIVSGGETYRNNGGPYSFTTGPLLDPPAGSHVAYGPIYRADGTPQEGAVVILHLEDKDG